MLRKNIEQNNLQEFIELRLVENPKQILCGIVQQEEKFDFCMCNPPFFESIEESNQNPNTADSGTISEMVCEGGELAFVMKIMEDSLQLREQIRWYTSMLGRKVNIKIIKDELKKT